MAEKLCDAGPNLAVYKVNVEELAEQDVNAHVMAPEMMERLTENIKSEGRLESFPFSVARANGKFELVSGHHRVRAARAAGLTELFVIADTRDLPRSKVVAKQIAHNSIFGKDDKQTLKKLYDELDSIEDILESYLKPEDFDDIKQLQPSSITDLSLAIPWKHMTLVFLPRAMQSFERIGEFVEKTPKDTDIIGVVSMELLDRFRKAALELGRTEDVRSLGTIMARMTEIVEGYIEENKKEEDDAKEQSSSAA